MVAYSPFLKPIIAGGVRCVGFDRVLEHRDPPANAFLLQFARDNQLKRRPGRKTKRPEALAADAAAGAVQPRPEGRAAVACRKRAGAKLLTPSP